MLVGAAIFAAACASHSNSSNGTTELKANIGLDLSQVSGFVIAPPSSSSGVMRDAVPDGGQVANELYAIGADGTLTVVTLTEEPDGGQVSTTTAVMPEGIFDTPGYVFFAYQGITHGMDTCEFVLARKSDGALFCLSDVGMWQAPMTPFPLIAPVVQADSTGDIVWMNVGQAVDRVDLSDPANLTVTQAVVTGVPYEVGQAVNAAGDDLVSGLAGSLPFLRVMFPTGGFLNVTADQNVGCLVPGSSANPNDLYYSDNTSWETAPSLIKLAWTATNTFTPTPIAASTGSYVDCEAGAIRAGTHLLFTHAEAKETPQYAQFLDVVNDVPTLQIAAPLTTAQKIAACDATAFIVGTDASGNGGIVAYDLASSALSTLLTPGDYALSAMDVAPSCEVTFSGQRASDGAYILGNIPAGGGQVSVLATGFPAVSQIQRIN